MQLAHPIWTMHPFVLTESYALLHGKLETDALTRGVQWCCG